MCLSAQPDMCYFINTASKQYKTDIFDRWKRQKSTGAYWCIMFSV